MANEVTLPGGVEACLSEDDLEPVGRLPAAPVTGGILSSIPRPAAGGGIGHLLFPSSFSAIAPRPPVPFGSIVVLTQSAGVVQLDVDGQVANLRLVLVTSL